MRAALRSRPMLSCSLRGAFMFRLISISILLLGLSACGSSSSTNSESAAPGGNTAVAKPTTEEPDSGDTITIGSCGGATCPSGTICISNRFCTLDLGDTAAGCDCTAEVVEICSHEISEEITSSVAPAGDCNAEQKLHCQKGLSCNNGKCQFTPTGFCPLN